MILSIIINHYKSPEVLKLCLNYLKKNAPQGSEIIVTDSETIEKTQDMMRYDFPEIIFLQEKKNVGFAKSVNRGIGNAQGDFFLIINADVMITEKTAIPQMLAYMKEHKDIGILLYARHYPCPPHAFREDTLGQERIKSFSNNEGV